MRDFYRSDTAVLSTLRRHDRICLNLSYKLGSVFTSPHTTQLLRGISQSELARQLNTNHSIIGKHERDEVKPTVDVVKRLADSLDTAVGFLLGEPEDMNLLKDPSMLKSSMK